MLRPISEMSRFINILLEDCRALQIQLPDKEDIERVRREVQ